ncbi:3-oxoacyl-[acyl-carrier-protein] reductase [Lacticaseibacillus daqingensis]|uniref:3-oxoacyl-[acyl-carrier-protein] reductase n=1 Tax=Lacticaseibacillus daqingensis TaxID=2486014 RepID=UPI000F77D75B|nr:3-oxoacyl-[acyl-carrier-protein] reductase [Lacticaseibacillus daqingensis]
MLLTDKVALVTGSTRGIGAAIARDLAQAGAHVVLNGTTAVPAALVTELQALGHEVLALPARIDDADAAATLVQATLAHFGRLDILVNNAGITKDGLAMRMTPAQFNDVIAVNLNGTFNVTQPAFKAMMKAKQGVIVNLSSVVGLTGNIGQANYAASKAGVIGLTKSLAKEGAMRGVRVNAVAPGMIATQMTAGLSASVQADLTQAIPLKRFGQPEEVASAVRFLIENAYVTGQVLTVDGGLTS